MPQQALHEALLPSAYSYSARKDAAMLAEEERERGEREEREKKGKKSEILQREKVGKGKGKGVEVVGEKGREGEGWNRRTNPFWGRCGDSSFVSSSPPPSLPSPPFPLRIPHPVNILTKVG